MTAGIARAPYAADPAQTRGRLHPEPESATRTSFQRDRDRIIHSGAFRRLKHKTQVFVAHYGDYYRTRLTHSLEVAQIARSISRVLGLDEDLAEALALAHDLGHTPFGHAGEDALRDCMANFGGFDHNAQTLLIVTELEERYAAFNGLNLTWETLEGIAKHNGPLIRAGVAADLPEAIAAYMENQDLRLDTFAPLEAQVAALSDDIAYNNHDIDDGLRAALFTIDDLRGLPMIADVLGGVERLYPSVEPKRLAQEAIRRLITVWVDDVLCETRRRLAETEPRSPEDIRMAGRPTANFSNAMRGDIQDLRDFLFANMYRHYSVSRSMAKAKRVLTDLFDQFIEQPNLMPPDWARRSDRSDPRKTARTVCNYIAGMSDRFALLEHKRLFDLGLEI